MGYIWLIYGLKMSCSKQKDETTACCYAGQVGFWAIARPAGMSA